MKKKYNLALVPLKKSNEFVKLASKFSSISEKYLLGNNSYPHVTLYQFEENEELINNIWQKVCEQWQYSSIILHLNTFSYITFDQNIYWISLLPSNSEVLHEMHALIANILLLPIKQNYDPHLTLISTKNAYYYDEIDKLSNNLKFTIDEFQLVLGKSDDIGQLTEIIF